MILLYLSASSESNSNEELKTLCQKASDFNTSKGITGFLYYSSPYFFQVLEGPESEVKSLYQSIKLDPRHTIEKDFVWNDVDGRLFPGWSMRFLRPLPKDKVEIEDILEQVLKSNLDKHFGEERFSKKIFSFIKWLSVSKKKFQHLGPLEYI